MEPNPIYWLELKQLRRGGFLYALTGAGLIMSGFLYVVMRYGLEFDSSTYLYMVPVLFYTLGILGAPLIAGLRFAFKQVSGDLIYDTPLSGPVIVLGKFRSAVALVLCLYLPAIPGAVYQSYHGEFRHLIAFAGCAWLTTVFSAAAVGFAAGTKTVAGALGKIAWVVVYAGFSMGLCIGTATGIDHTLWEMGVTSHPTPAIAILSAVFWGGLGIMLPLWRGSIVMEKVGKPGRLIATLFILWIGTITAAIGFLLFRMMLGLHATGGGLLYVGIAASVFYFSCLVGDRETKSRSVTFY